MEISITRCFVFMITLIQYGTGNSIEDNMNSMMQDEDFRNIKELLHNMAARTERSRQDRDHGVVPSGGSRKMSKSGSRGDMSKRRNEADPDYITMDRKGNIIVRKNSENSEEAKWFPAPVSPGNIDIDKELDIVQHLDKHIHEVLPSQPTTTPNVVIPAQNTEPKGTFSTPKNVISAQNSKSQQTPTTSKSPGDKTLLQAEPSSPSTKGSVTPAAVLTPATPQNKGNSTKKFSFKDIKGRVKQKFKDLTEDAAFWIGMATGASVTLIIVSIILLLRCIAMKIKSAKEKYATKNLNVNSFCDYARDPVYVRLSQLHDPRTRQPHVVTVLDQSNNFSICTSSESSTEEEIFNASEMLSPLVGGKSGENTSSVNRTSTPLRGSCVRQLYSIHSTPTKRLQRDNMASPVSPLSSIPPVFASPIKLEPNNMVSQMTPPASKRPMYVSPHKIEHYQTELIVSPLASVSPVFASPIKMEPINMVSPSTSVKRAFTYASPLKLDDQVASTVSPQASGSSVYASPIKLDAQQ